MLNPIRAFIYKFPPRIRQFVPVFGGLLSLITFGTIYTSGNIQPYLVSYLREYVDPTLSGNRMVWIFTLQLTFPPLGICIGGLLEKRFGPRIASLIGGCLMSAGTFLSYFTIKQSYGALVLTFGILFGFGHAMAMPQPIVCAMRWMPHHKGLGTGLVMAGYGIGGLIFSPIQTKFVNPSNFESDSNGYFHQKELLDRVPAMFLMLGCCYIVMQFLGSLLLENPQVETSEEEAPLIAPKMLKRSVPLREVLRSNSFWWIFFSFGCNTPVITMTSSFYKQFGQTFINDDLFLATVGSVSAIFNTIGRIFWGVIADRYSYQVAMCCATSLQCVLMLTFLVARYCGQWMYLIWVCLLYLGFSSNFTLFPLVTSKCFGSENFAIIYGFISLAVVASSYLIAGLADGLLDVIGYGGIWFISAILVYITFILTTTIQKTKYGSETNIKETLNQNGHYKQLANEIIEDVKSHRRSIDYNEN